MAEKSEGALALLDGMAEELAGAVRKHWDALKEAPVVAEAAAVERTMKVIVSIGRANLIVRQVQAAEDKVAADKAQRLNNLEQMKMDDITPEELEQRADELRARFDRIMATLEAKRRSVASPVAGSDADGAGSLGAERPRRAA